MRASAEAGFRVCPPSPKHEHERSPMNHSEIVSFLWGVADLIRDTFRRGHYQDVILPLTVLRRLDCVLAQTKDKVLARSGRTYPTLRGRSRDHRVA